MNTDGMCKMIQCINKFSASIIGETYYMTLLLTNMSERIARNGNTFVKLRFMDGNSTAEAKMFNTSIIQLNEIGVEGVSVVDVTIEVSDYAGKSYIVKDIIPNNNPDLSIENYIVRPPVDEDVMFNEVEDIILKSHIENGTRYLPLSTLAIEIIEKFREPFITSSAALMVHHNYKGGLLYHTYRMVKAADQLTNTYTDLNKELLVCGAALHDIGKIVSYNTSMLGETTMTSYGVLYGHPFCGAMIVNAVSAKRNYNPEEVKLLIHILLSHHGKGEYGAVIAPAIPEAFAVHHLDNMDAKIAQCEKVYEDLDAGDITAKRPFAFHNRLYKPGCVYM